MSKCENKCDSAAIIEKLEGIREAVMLLVSALYHTSAAKAGYPDDGTKATIPGYVAADEVWKMFAMEGRRVRLDDWRAYVADYVVNVCGVNMLPEVTAKAMYQCYCENTGKGACRGKE